MGNLAPGRPVYNTALNLYYANIGFNIFASFLTLVLIWYMRHNGSLKVNLYLKCVLLMTFHQLLFDISLTLNNECGVNSLFRACTSFFIACYTTGGLGAGLWALMIVGVTAFMVEYGRQPSVKETYVSFALLEVFILTFAAINAQAGYMPRSATFVKVNFGYNTCRLVIIGVTFLVLLRLVYKIRQVTHGTDRASSPLYHLTRRLIWYPIVQVVCRLGPTPYNYLYVTIDAYPAHGAPFLQTLLLFAYVVLAPMAGIGALLVFLWFQNGSPSSLWRLCGCEWLCGSKIADVGAEPATRTHRKASVAARRVSAPEGGAVAVLAPAQLETNIRDARSVHPRDLDYSFEYSDAAEEEEGPSDTWQRLSIMDEGDLMRQFIRERATTLTAAVEGRRSSAVNAIPSAPKSVESQNTRLEAAVPTSPAVSDSVLFGRNPMHDL